MRSGLTSRRGRKPCRSARQQTRTILVCWLMNKSCPSLLWFISELSKEKKIDFFVNLKEAVNEKGDLSARQEKWWKSWKDRNLITLEAFLQGHLRVDEKVWTSWGSPGASKWRTWWSRWGWLRFESWKGEAPKPVKLLTRAFRRAVSKSNA